MSAARPRAEMELAVAVSNLVYYNRSWGAGWFHPRLMKAVAVDPDLTVFIEHLFREGRDAWREESLRISRQPGYAARLDVPPDGRSPKPPLKAVAELLPTWRTWGRMLRIARTPESEHSEHAITHQ